MKKILIAVFLLCFFALPACSSGAEINYTPTPTLALMTNTPEPMVETIDFTALYSNGGMHDITYSTDVFVFNSQREYKLHNKIAIDKFRFNDFLFADLPTQDDPLDTKIDGRYDDDFFAENTLVVLFFVEPRSLTIYHEVTEIEQYMSRINIKIDSMVPDIGLPAEKYCCIVIEIPKNYYLSTDIVTVEFTDVNLSETEGN